MSLLFICVISETSATASLLTDFTPGLYVVTVKDVRVAISSHISSPLQNPEKMAILADHIMSVLSSIQMEKTYMETNLVSIDQ